MHRVDTAGQRVFESSARRCGAPTVRRRATTRHDVPTERYSRSLGSSVLLPLGDQAAVLRVAFPSPSAGSPPPGPVGTRRPLMRFSDGERWRLLLAVRGGTVQIEHGGLRSALRPGDLVLLDASRPCAASAVPDGPAEALAVRLSRHAVPLPHRTLRPLVAHRLPSGTGTGALLVQLLGGPVEQRPTLTKGDARRLESTVVALTTAFLASLIDEEEPRTTAARHVVRLHQIKDFIRARLRDPGLCPRSIAAAHHVSLRTLHYLFRHDGRTVGAFLREERLALFRAELCDPRTADRSVAAIAVRVGFPDAATAGRAFRKRYGLPPGAYRRSVTVGKPSCEDRGTPRPVPHPTG